MVDQAITTHIDAAVALQQVGKTSLARRRYLTLLPLEPFLLNFGYTA